MDDLPIRLEQFRNAFRPAGGTHGQQIGEESYALRCNGRALSVLAEAADEITRLRAELAAVRRVLNHAVAMAMDCDPELPHYLDRAEEHIDAARKGEEKP